MPPRRELNKRRAENHLVNLRPCERRVVFISGDPAPLRPSTRLLPYFDCFIDPLDLSLADVKRKVKLQFLASNRSDVATTRC